ncbi:TolC family protein [Flavobacterium paronense]|uniref:TolC family protein n=1 Tax=Flavobacterium paronense TaxID=1392775 RepID=A0ABV5GEA8_9FLAO|nr:TolC family protein [Flavobacterium paronense]MDN3678206.1 TolC family protein [Flavobacterium paronense]
MKNKIVLTLVLVSGLLQAQDKAQTFSFSLQQAIDYALQYNYSAINANRDVASAKQKKWETTAAGLPQISGNAAYLNNFDFTLQGISGNAFNPAASPNDISLVAFGTKQSMNSSLTLSQLLFDGSYIVALQASKTYLKYYENYKIKTNTDVKEMVINAYGNVLLAEESVAILEKNKTTLSKTLFDTKETYKNGLIEEENVEQLQITLASIESNLNNTKRLSDVAYKMLKFTLGIDINSELTLTDKLDNLTVSNLDMALSQKGFDVNTNINYQIASNFQEQRSLELKLQRSKALPSLAAAVNFGYNSFSNDFSFADGKQKWNKFSNLGVNLSVPIFSSFGRQAKTQQAKIAFEQAKTQLSQTEQQLKLEYEKAKSEYDFSIEEYATSKSNLSLAERIEKKQQIKFSEGLSSSFDFSEAQRQLYTAQQNYLQSMVNIITKKAALEKLINKN